MVSSQSQPLWGKMNVAQMLAHLQMPMGSAQGIYKVPRTLFGRIVGPFAKSIFYGDKAFKRNLPTDQSFVMTNSEKDFEKEKQGLLIMNSNFKEENIVNEVHSFFGKNDEGTMERWYKETS
jgi:hypothetical protein